MSPTSLTRVSLVARYTEGLPGPVILHVKNCVHCPLSLACMAGVSLYEGNYNFAACSRCWCVYFELHPQKELHICARLRHGIYERADVWGTRHQVPSERVRVAIDAADHRFIRMLEETDSDLGTPTGCKEFARKMPHRGSSFRSIWNPEHPINLSENLREYRGGNNNDYRDDSISVVAADCLTSYSQFAAHGVIVH